MTSAQRGQVFRTKTGVSIRWYDHTGRRRQQGGFRTKAEAATVLEERLRQVRLGALYRPDLTLDELVARFLEQYDAAPASRSWLVYYLGFSQRAFGATLIARLDAQTIGAWRARLVDQAGKPASDHMKHSALRALRQVLAAAERWGWIERNPARLVKNDGARPAQFTPFDSWADVDAITGELDPVGAALVATAVGTGLRPEELFALRTADVDLADRVLRVMRAFAKGRMKDYPKTSGSRRQVPLRSRVVDALERLDAADGRTPAQQVSPLLFPGDRGGPIILNNWRRRDFYPAQLTAGVTPPRKPYEMRHTYATWSLAAGVNPFQLARRMGTSLAMIQQTYGHLLGDADDLERATLDAWDDLGGTDG